MTVKVILKKPAPNGEREFVFGESAILDDKEAGWVVLSCGGVSGNRENTRRYEYTDIQHITYAWRDIERIEVTP